MKNYKCTDCKKFYNINKGTYDEEWGFHCVHCGGICTCYDIYGANCPIYEDKVRPEIDDIIINIEESK